MRTTILLSIVAILLLGGCWNKPDILYIGEVKNQIASFPMHFAVEAEFFDVEKVQFRTYSSEEKLFEALRKGSVDLAALPAAWSMLDESGATGIIEPLQRGGGGIVSPHSIETLEELKGRPVGAIASSQLAELTTMLNEKNNLGWDIRLYSSEKKMVGDFKDGVIDAFSATTPGITGYAVYYNIACWFSDEFGYYPTFSILTNMNALDKKTALIDEFLGQMDNGINLINQRPTETYANFSKLCYIHGRFARDVLLQTRYITNAFPSDEDFENRVKNLAATRRAVQKPRTYHQAMAR